MKIAFTNPPWFTKDEMTGALMKGVRAGSRWPNQYTAICKSGGWAEGMYLPFPFFMAHAASYVAKNCEGADVKLRDSIALNETYQAFWSWLRHEQPELIFFESATPCWEHDAKLIVRIAEFCPNAKVAVCGPIAHPSCGKQAEILALPNVVAAIAGEYEKGCVRVANGQTGAIPFEALTLAEMNEAPFPMQSADMIWRYHDACPYSPVMPHAQIYASRGCNFHCDFCSFPSVMTNDDPTGTGKRTVRQYSAEYLDEYIGELVGKYRIKSVYFDDDTFNLGNKHVARVCAVMAKHRLPWSAMCRADTVTWETWELLAASGCYGVKIGFESGVQSVVDKMGKDLNVKEARMTAIKLRGIGMSVHTTWTLGHPGETRAQMQATLDFMKTVPHNSYQIAGTALLDGTPNAERDKTEHIEESFSRTTEGNAKLKEIWAQIAQQ